MAVGRARELLATLTMAGYVLPARGTNDMSRRLLLINLMLGLFCLAFAIGIVRSLLVKRPLPAGAATRTAVAPAPAAIGAPSVPGPETYASITTQTLFNPARSEKATAAAAAAVVKPILHGIVIEGPKSRAFLEDPSVKRVEGYSVGDPVAGGTLQKITDDRVVIARSEGLVEVLLQDPAKPRPAPTAPAAPVAAGAPGQPVPGRQGSSPAPGQPVPVPSVPSRAVLPPPSAASTQTVTSTPDHILGQALPSDTPGNLPPVAPSQGQRRATARTAR